MPETDRIVVDLLGATPAEREAVYAQLGKDAGADYARDVRRLVERRLAAVVS